MKILLDTHVFLWFISGDSKLVPAAQALIEDPTSERFISTAAIWEITIKSSLGKLTVPTPPSTLIKDHIWSNAIDILAIQPNHLDILQTLPYHHKDPFDRLMIAQAIADNLNVITADGAFSDYSVSTSWAD